MYSNIKEMNVPAEPARLAITGAYATQVAYVAR